MGYIPIRGLLALFFKGVNMTKPYDIQKKKRKRQRLKTIFKWFASITIVLVTLTSLLAVIFVQNHLKTLPDVNSQQLNTFGPTKILDDSDNVIYQDPATRYTEITYEQIPDLYKKGLIATEDKSFWENKGISLKAQIVMILGSVYSKINKSYRPRGGSTLTQQLIKNKYFNGGRGVDTVTRKIQEIHLSSQVAEKFSKKDILTKYVNSLEYSEGATGLATIMMTYFGKIPEQYSERTVQNIAEQAYLIGLGQAPSGYNLYEHPEDAQTRMRTVLKILLDEELISKTEYEEAKNYDLTSNLQPRFRESEAQRLQNLKYKVYTDEVLNELYRLGYNPKDASLTVHTFLNQTTFDNITNTVRNAQYYQDGEGGSEQVGATVINSEGIVVGMVGSRYADDELNRATQNTRSSGSSTKPFTAYAPLLQYFGNQYNTASSFSTAPYLYPGTSVYMNNYGNYTYGVQNIQYALRMSLNTPVGRIDDEILGSTRMKKFLNGVGLDVKASYSSVDGIGINISTLQAAAAYNAINNGGVYTEPRFINKITFVDKSEKVVEPKRVQAMNASTAFVLSQMLRGVVSAPYTAKEAAIPQYEGYAGKTGSVALDATSGAYPAYGIGGSDVWYDSITNGGYSIALWFGYDKPNESPQVADDFKGPQWLGRDLQLQLNAGRNVPNWTQPSTVSFLGGSGFDTHWAITDSADIDSSLSTGVEVPAISGNYSIFNTIKSVNSQSDIKSTWSKDLTGKDKQRFDFYQMTPDELENTNIINSSLYNILED